MNMWSDVVRCLDVHGQVSGDWPSDWQESWTKSNFALLFNSQYLSY